MFLYLGSFCIQFSVEACNISVDVLGGFGEVRSGRSREGSQKGKYGAGGQGKFWEDFKEVYRCSHKDCRKNTRGSVQLRNDVRTGQWVMGTAGDCW